MNHPRDAYREALASVRLALESELAFGRNELPRADIPRRPKPQPQSLLPTFKTPPPALHGKPVPQNTAQPTRLNAPPRFEGKLSSAPDLAISAPRNPNLKTEPPAQPVRVPVAPLKEQLGSPDRIEALAQLSRDVYACENCRLASGRTYAAPGEGNADADLMFIGEGPGADEDRSGRPFVGAAGELLTKIIGAMGFSRETVYIANIVKCRPPENRVPQNDEVAACDPFLKRQIDIVKPKVICTLGSPATKALLGVTTGITQLRGKLLSWNGIPVVPTFHPAYLLRNANDKPLVWADVQMIAKLVEEKGGRIPFPEVLARASQKGKSAGS